MGIPNIEPFDDDEDQKFEREIYLKLLEAERELEISGKTYSQQEVMEYVKAIIDGQADV